MAEPFDARKTDPALQAAAFGMRRIWLHLWPDRASFAAFQEKQTGRGEDWDDSWEAAAVTDDFDDVYCAEYPAWREVLGIGTVTVLRHELRHIYLNGPDEDGVRNGEDEHHHILRCAALGLCVGANHGARFLPVHAGGVPAHVATTLLERTRAAPAHDGVRHGFIDVPDADIQRPEE